VRIGTFIDAPFNSISLSTLTLSNHLNDLTKSLSGPSFAPSWRMLEDSAYPFDRMHSGALAMHCY